MNPPVHLLIATVPWRRWSIDFLLGNLHRQTRRPDRFELVLDGYGDTPGPMLLSPNVREWRTPAPTGPGNRWRVAAELPPDAILVVIDDDVVISKAPRLIESLVAGVEAGEAVAASGCALNGVHVRWGARWEGTAYDGTLICLNATAMAVRVGDLEGLQEFRQRLVSGVGYDPMGMNGDDESAVSAHLWKRGVKMRHVPVDGLELMTGTQERSQMVERAKDGAWDRQRVDIARVTGWPWVST